VLLLIWGDSLQLNRAGMPTADRGMNPHDHALFPGMTDLSLADQLTTIWSLTHDDAVDHA